MTLEQQIEEAILSTLVVENKESIKTFCLPKIKELALELAQEAYDRGRGDGADWSWGLGNGSFKQFIQEWG